MTYRTYTLSRSETGKGKSQQGYDLIEVIRVVGDDDAHTLRILIHFDSGYAHQSEARIERWALCQWHEVHRLLGPVMQSRVVAHPDPDGRYPRLETVYTPGRDLGITNRAKQALKTMRSKA